MDVLNREKCATCPDRGSLSYIAAKLVLGKEYKSDDCRGAIPVRKDNHQVSSDDRMFGGVITTIKYDCGLPNEDGSPKADYVEYNWLDGELISTINHDTDVYTNLRNPERSDGA